MEILISNWTVFALAVSVTALVVTYLNYRRKSSVSLRGSFTLSFSVECEDGFVSNIVLENMKDRAVTIYGIYFLVGYNYLVELEEFDESPIILRAFETITREYGPIEFYGVNDRRLSMSSILRDKRAHKRLVLSTSEGRYAVRKHPKRWYPIRDHFRNHALALVRPVRATYKQKDIGGNVRYVVDVVLSDGKNEIIMLRAEDWNSQRFRAFRLTKESLETAASLSDFLSERQVDGTLVCKSFKVFDAQAWRASERDFYRDDSLQAEYMGYVQFNVFGRIATSARDFVMRRENARLARERKNGHGRI